MKFPILWSERGIKMAMRNHDDKNETHIVCLGRIILCISPKIDESLFLPLQKYLEGTSPDIDSTERNIEIFLKQKFIKTRWVK